MLWIDLRILIVDTGRVLWRLLPLIMGRERRSFSSASDDDVGGSKCQRQPKTDPLTAVEF
jgi:hypothetical protein